MDDLTFRSLLEDYHLESRERLAQIEESLVDLERSQGAARDELIVAAQRELHTLKGNSGMMGLGELRDFAHQLEDRVAALREGASALEVAALLRELDRYRGQLDAACGVAPAGDSAGGIEATGHKGVRVSFAALDPIVDQLSEMVILQNRHADCLGQALTTLPEELHADPRWQDVEGSRQALYQTLDQLRSGVMGLRMVPLGNLFGQLKRVVFEESAACGKDIELQASGGQTPLDRALLEVTSEVLGHLVRNAVIHGIEGAEERQAGGKPARSTLSLVAAAGTDEVLIDIEDDGRGIDRQALSRKANALGLDVGPDPELQDLLFHPGLTTRETTDKSSGRGMGLAAVAEAVRRHGGAVEALTVAGEGTRFRLRLPISASIQRGLGLLADGEEYALPAGAVQEVLGVDAEVRHRVHQSGVVRWREALVPIVDLGAAFGTAARMRDHGLIVVVEVEGRTRGLLVDDVTGIQDIVVKPLHEIAGDPEGISGCTILGDGRVIMILDPRQLARIPPTLEQTA